MHACLQSFLPLPYFALGHTTVDHTPSHHITPHRSTLQYKTLHYITWHQINYGALNYCMHACINTYVHKCNAMTYTHKYVHTDRQTDGRTDTQKYKHTDMPTHKHTRSMLSYAHTYIRRCILPYLPTYIHPPTYASTLWFMHIRVCTYTFIFLTKCEYVHTYHVRT